MLVVIGIVVVLAAMLLPIVNRAREAANRAACASKQRQLLTGTFAYMANWDGFGPPQGNFTVYSKAAWKWAQYPQALDKYFGFNTPMSGGLIQLKGKAAGIRMYYGADACPSGAAAVTNPGNITQITSPDDTTSNWAFGANSNVLDPGWHIVMPGQESRWYRLTAFRGDDLRVFLFMDCPGRSIGVSPSLPLESSVARKRHRSEGANFAFVDGHVEFIPYDRDLKTYSTLPGAVPPFLKKPMHAKPIQ
jgi:prepilin-type processing-associated H-X9-DG protein